MAVRDENVGLTPASAQELTIIQRLHGSGADPKIIQAKFELAAADSDASIFRCFPSLSAYAIPLKIYVANDAVTAGTDWDVGIYTSGVGGAVIASKVNYFADALDLSTAHASINPKTALDGMKDLDIDNLYKRLFEHAGHTTINKSATYDICLTANTIGSSTGTVVVELTYVIGGTG